MSGTSEEIRALMRENLRMEIAGYFDSESEGREIVNRMEEYFHGKAKCQEDYMKDFMTHLTQLKAIKHERRDDPASARSMGASIAQSYRDRLQTGPSNATRVVATPVTPVLAPTPTAAQMDFVAITATSTVQNESPNDVKRKMEIIEYLSQCQKKISPSFIATITDARQKKFFDQLVQDMHSVRTQLSLGQFPTHPDLAPRIRLIVEKVRAINKSQEQQAEQIKLRTQQQGNGSASASQATVGPLTAVGRPGGARAGQFSRVRSLNPSIALAAAVSGEVHNSPSMSGYRPHSVLTPALVTGTAQRKGTKRKPSGDISRVPAAHGGARRTGVPVNASSSAATAAASTTTTPTAGSVAVTAPLGSATAISIESVDAANDKQNVAPGIAGFFDELCRLDKKMVATLMKQSSSRIGDMLSYLVHRKGFPAAQLARQIETKQRTVGVSKPSIVSSEPASTDSGSTAKDPSSTETNQPEDSESSDLDAAASTLLKGEMAATNDEMTIPDQGVPFRRELEQIRQSDLFAITTCPGSNHSWRLIQFDFKDIPVPLLVVGIRNDYDVDPSLPSESHLNDKLDYRIKTGRSTLNDHHIYQVHRLLRRCMAQRRHRLYDLVCMWHNVIKHVFSLPNDRSEQDDAAATIENQQISALNKN